MITYTKADVIARAAKLDKYGHKQAAQMLRDFAPMVGQPQSADGLTQPDLGEGVSVNIFGLIAAINQIPVRREAMSGQMLTYVQRDEVIGTIEDFAARHARGVLDGWDAFDRVVRWLRIQANSAKSPEREVFVESHNAAKSIKRSMLESPEVQS